MDEKTVIYIIRHGETDYNTEKRFQGGMDIYLNERGKTQSEALAQYLRPVPINAIYSSDLTRTLQTAAPLAENKNIEIVLMPAFREIDFGDWEGKTLSCIREFYPQQAKLWEDDTDKLQIPGGESFVQAAQRAFSGLEILAQRHTGQQIAVFTHGGILRLLLSKILNCPFNNAWKIRQDNCAVNILEYKSGKFCINLLNYNGYL